jgi:hypothetical protein
LYWWNTPKLFLKCKINAPAVVRLDALLRPPTGGLHKFGKFSRLERSFFGAVWMPARLIVGRQG